MQHKLYKHFVRIYTVYVYSSNEMVVILFPGYSHDECPCNDISFIFCISFPLGILNINPVCVFDKILHKTNTIHF